MGRLLDGFGFDNEAVINQQIDQVPLCNAYALVFDRQDNLAPMRDSPKLQLPAKASVVARLEKARPEATVDLDRGADDPFADRIDWMLDQCHTTSSDVPTSEVSVGHHNHFRMLE
jgi:hypothetical protein